MDFLVVSTCSCDVTVYLQWDPFIWTPKIQNTQSTEEPWWGHKFIKPGHLAEKDFGTDIIIYTASLLGEF